ncbi:glycerophosphodiester phosphodiesterase [Thermus oshimai]|uniref:glycerophosphodiester phosphodiesterase n=1 Tax=Thermus oshimai TaxID=56957 RepID=UPI000376F8D5|nr:glycerophosphodiester phosphodiesterase [Thermus oshimai]
MPLRLGHRGAPLKAKENTLEAFALALEAGLDGFELDVQFTEDGVLVVHHDFTLEGVPVRALKREDLPPYVPTLEEVLKAFPEAWINVELKSIPGETDGREEALARLLGRHPSPRVWVSSFDPLALLRLKRLGVRPLGFLYSVREAEELAPCLGVEWLHPEERLLTPEGVARLKAQGYRLLAWTVNSRARAEELVRMGVDALVGDRPEALV